MNHNIHPDQLQQQQQQQNHLQDHDQQAQLMHNLNHRVQFAQHQQVQTFEQQPFHQSQRQNTATNYHVKLVNKTDNDFPVSMTTEQTNDNMNSKHSNMKYHDSMMGQLKTLVQSTLKLDPLVHKINDLTEKFIVELHKRSCIRAKYTLQLTHEQENAIPEIREIMKTISRLMKEFESDREKFITSHNEIFNQMLILQNKILYECLPEWHHNQQLLNNGVKVETINLDTIQAWIEEITFIIWRIKNQIKGVQRAFSEKYLAPDNIRKESNVFVKRVNRALEQLIMNSFIVEKQPPQVMKTNTRFTATVRFLCGNKLSLQMMNPTVKALILSEANARTVIKYHKQMIEQSWALLENSANQPQAQNNQIGQHSSAQGSVGGGHQVQLSGQSNSVISPVHSLAPSPQSMAMNQQHYVTYGQAPNNSQSSSSPEQPISLVDHHNQDSQYLTDTNHVNKTTQHYMSITEFGYNPDFPINSKDFETSGEILNNSNILEYQEQSRHMISHFRNMQLKKIKRTEKKGTESVMDEKFVLLFFTEFGLDDSSFCTDSPKSPTRVRRRSMLFHMLAISLPVVVIVHGNQEPHAWATVTWHNAFATPDDILYKVPDKVTWRQLGSVLSEKFRSFSGRGLSEDNLNYLGRLVLRRCIDNDDVLITWNQFSKESMIDKSFTFWEWFHAIVKLTREHLRDLWKADRIIGFVGKSGCNDLLLGSPYHEIAQLGTFLLRFSESELGGVAIAWVSEGDEITDYATCGMVHMPRRLTQTSTGNRFVKHLQPWMSIDLRTRSMADRVRDLNDLVYLYPRTPKDEAFGPFYTPISNNIIHNKSYYGSLLVAKIAAKYVSGVESNSSAMTSPQNPALTSISGSQCSQEGYYQDNIDVNDAMDSDYTQFDTVTGDYNYPIQQ